MVLFQTAKRRLGRTVRQSATNLKRARVDWGLRSAVKEQRLLLEQARKRYAPSYFNNRCPVVSIVTATYNRGEMLVERAIASALRQTYQNFEMIVVGDCCTDDTEERVRDVGDPRIRFVNLPERGRYPSSPLERWLVAGIPPANRALQLAKGDWIAHLDDDDEFTPEHIEVLLHHALNNDLELVYGICRREARPGEWIERGDPRFELGICLPSASLTRCYLKVFKYDLDGWRTGLCQDKHRWRRMYKAGVRTGFVNRIVTLAPLRPGTTTLDYTAEDRH